MTTGQDVIAALNQRRLLKTGHEPSPSQLPVGWQGWLDATVQAAAPIRHAAPQAWIDRLVQRPAPSVSKSGGLGLPFFQLLRLGRPPDPREDRKLRIGVVSVDVLLHIVLVALLLWLMYLRFLALAQQQEDEQGEAVQVEFIGRGNVATGGGALANAGAESAPAAASAAQKLSPKAGQAAASAADASTPVVPERVAATPPQALATDQAAPKLEQPKPVPTEASAAQQLQVSNVPQPQPEHFQLPPPRERSVVLPDVKLRDVQPQQQVEAIATLEAKPVQTLQVKPRDLPLRAPELKTQVQALETFTPDASVLTRERTAVSKSSASASVQVPQLRGQVRELPLQDGDGGAVAAKPGNGSAISGQATTGDAGGHNANSAGTGLAVTGKGAGTQAAANGGRGVSSAGAGAGPGLKPAPGGWPGAAKSDDWGASNRNVAGTGKGGRDGKGTGKGEGKGEGKPGLFNADGSARLPDTWSKNSGVDLDRSGTWLQRPGLEYRGTRFDKYWIPEGNLLQEWVRKGVKELSIPIPGTKLKLKCVVSLLQFGGGCMPENPDANEQNSTGRKAPEIPFKPQLQEDNGSVRPAPAAAGTPPAGTP